MITRRLAIIAGTVLILGTACSSEADNGAGGGGATADTCPPADLSATCSDTSLTCEGEREDGCPVMLSCFVHIDTGSWQQDPPDDGSLCGEPGEVCEYSVYVGDNCPYYATATCEAGAWSVTGYYGPPCGVGGSGGSGGGGGSGGSGGGGQGGAGG